MPGLLADYARLLGLNEGTTLVLWLVFLGLTAATLITRWVTRNAPERGNTELELRVRSWWVMSALIAGSLIAGKGAAIALFAFISFFALKEFYSIIPVRPVDRAVLFWTYLAVPIQFGLVWYEQYGIFIVFVPVYMFLILPAAMVVAGNTQGFLKAVGTLHWGLMTTVYSLGHIAYLLVLPAEAQSGSIAIGAGLVMALIVLTELNDVAQYIWGKSFGRHRITPNVSPNKTWEGFLGGVATTSLAAVVVLPLLTPHSGWLALGLGLLIAVAGFFGDLTESAVKRDLGIKDSGSIIPGHGGILDRVDSLIFTAPLFFHYTRYFQWQALGAS
jgi:phosphatidate cytidylyltransferase